MKARTITSLSILTAIIVLLGLEGWLLSNNEEGDTISEVVQDSIFKWPVIGFLLGLLCGHFVWPIHRRKPYVSWRLSTETEET